MSYFRTCAFTVLLLLLLIGLGACEKSRQRQAAARSAYQPCSRDKRCVKPQVCLLRPQVAAGTCVNACGRDQDCGPGLACTGRFQTPRGAGQKTRRYCRRASVDEGGDCSRLTDGCKPGLQCARGRTCVRACKENNDCQPDERCEPVPEKRTFGRPAPPLYHACVKAAVKENGACSLGAHPRCGRGLRCYRNRCVKLCAADAGCGEGRVCDGRGKEAALKPGAEPPPGFRYCRRAAEQGQRCSRHWSRDVGCIDGLQCYRGRCRKPCTSTEDCPASAHRKLRCITRRWRKQRVRLCL